MGITDQPFVRNKQGSDFLHQKEDSPIPNVKYIGTAARWTALTSEPLWEIKRIYLDPAGITHTEYASGGGFHHIWNDRASYFSASLPASVPAQQIEITPVLETATIENVTITTANTEQSHTFPTGTMKFLLRPRGNGKIKLSHDIGNSGSTYLTVSPGAVYESPDFKPLPKTIYFQSPTAGLVVEMESWA
jgi:hypothetical protein